MAYSFDFIKMEGLGNDYIYVDMQKNPTLEEAEVTQVEI